MPIAKEKKFEIKKYEVDGVKVMGVWIDYLFIEEVDIHSGFSYTDARKYLREKYLS